MVHHLQRRWKDKEDDVYHRVPTSWTRRDPLGGEAVDIANHVKPSSTTGSLEEARSLNEPTELTLQ